MWGIFGKPLKRAIWNTLGLHAGLTTCLRFSSLFDSACVACCLFCRQAATMSAYIFTQRAVASPDAPQKLLICFVFPMIKDDFYVHLTNIIVQSALSPTPQGLAHALRLSLAAAHALPLSLALVNAVPLSLAFVHS